MEHQNWEPQVLRKSAAQVKANAIRSGKTEAVERKTTEGSHFAKVEREEFLQPKRLAPESKQELVQRRLAEKLTQQQLDQRCSFPPHTVNQLEANKRAPTSKELQVLNRVLKCGLKLV